MLPSQAAWMKLLMGWMEQTASSCHRLLHKSGLATSPLLKSAPTSTLLRFCYHKCWPPQLLQPRTCYQQAPKSLCILLISAHSQQDHQKSELFGTGTVRTNTWAPSRDDKLTVLLEGCGAAAGSVAFLSRRKPQISHTLVEDFQQKPLVTSRNLVQLGSL